MATIWGKPTEADIHCALQCALDWHAERIGHYEMLARVTSKPDRQAGRLRTVEALRRGMRRTLEAMINPPAPPATAIAHRGAYLED